MQDPEFKAFVVIQSVLVVTITGYLAIGGHHTPEESFTHAVFQSISIGTTTGYTSAPFAQWPGALPVILILASFIGGCAGSTSGGMKVMRWLLIFKQGVRLGERGVPARVAEAVWGFFAIYVIVFGVMMSILMFTGLDQITAFSAVAATLNNLGPGLGEVSSTFGTINDTAKWVGIAAMILGRLEIFTLHS